MEFKEDKIIITIRNDDFKGFINYRIIRYLNYTNIKSPKIYKKMSISFLVYLFN